MTARALEVIPAIDIRGGRCVRLIQGDYGRETVFEDDPVAAARRWVEAGATRLHVVDLDGARGGTVSQRAVIQRLMEAVPLPIQVGGGIRSLADVLAMAEAGAARVVLGTAALKEPAVVEAGLRELGPERIVVALDARDGRVATEGWLEQSDVSVVELALRLKQAGLERVLYTDIARDGTLEGPNLTALRQVVEQTGLAVIASGGVTRAEDVRAVREAGAEAVIIGRALYTGAVTLSEAQRAAE